MIYALSEKQFNTIDYYFRKTSEPYDDWDWDGKELTIWYDGQVIERYSYQDLSKIIKNFKNL